MRRRRTRARVRVWCQIPMPEPSVGPAPEWLNEDGQWCWDYIVEHSEDMLAALDKPALILLCSAYGTGAAAQRDLHTRGPLIRGRSKDHSADEDDGEPAMVKNPSEQIARQEMEKFIKLAQEFGLTPAARVRMKRELEKPKPKGADDDLIN